MSGTTVDVLIARVTGAAQARVADAVERALLAALAQENQQTTNSTIVLSATGPDGALWGGLTAGTSYGWLLIKTLWVAGPHRGAGLGRRLMARAEAEGRRAGCHAAWLDTSSSSAHTAYLALGYADFGVLENAPGQPPEGHRRWFMRRDL